MKKFTLNFTEKELEALFSVIDTCSAVMEQDETTIKEIAIIDKALKKNKLKRVYN